MFCQGLRNLQLLFLGISLSNCHEFREVFHIFYGHIQKLLDFWQQLENLGSAFSFNIAIKSLTHSSCIRTISYYNMYNLSMKAKANKVRKLSMGNA